MLLGFYYYLVFYCSMSVVIIKNDDGLPMVAGHFGSKTLRHQDSSAPKKTGADVSGHFSTNLLVPNCLVLTIMKNGCMR